MVHCSEVGRLGGREGRRERETTGGREEEKERNEG